MWLAVINDTTVGGNAYFAISECIQCIDSPVRRSAGRKMYQYLYVGSRVVVYLTDFDLSFINSFQDRVDHCRSRLSVWNFCDSKCFIINLSDLGTYFHRSAAFSVVVFGYVDRTSCLEIRIQLEFLSTQITDGGIAKFVEVMR